MTEQSNSNKFSGINTGGDRPLPHNIDAETAVLASILIDSTTFDSVRGRLGSPESFYQPEHAVVYDAMCQIGDDDSRGAKSIDIVTLSDELNKSNRLETIGGMAALRRLMDSVVTAANVEHYVNIVYENAVLRRLIRTSTDITDRCYNADGDFRELIDAIESRLNEVLSGDTTNLAVPVRDHIMDVIDYMEQLNKEDPSAIGVRTGFNDLDRMITGLRPGEMFVLAARPSIGKTALALNMAENIALSSRKMAVGLFSLEMSTKMITLRLLCSRARVNIAQLRDSALSQARWKDIMDTAQALKDAPIYVDDSAAGLDVMELRSRARRMKAEYDIQVLFIDYLQLMRPAGGNRNTTRENDVAQISGGIKSLAKELNIPIVVLAQLNRQAEQIGARPKLAHLRESGAIEQDADVVALLHRERETDSETPPPPNTPLEAEVIVAKHRNGPTGVAKMLWFPSYTRFENRSPVSDNDVPPGME